MVGYLLRWRQPTMDDVETTERGRIWRDLDELVDICRSRNEKWENAAEYWPVAYDLKPKGGLANEKEDLRHLLGFTHPRRQRKQPDA